MNQTRVFVSGNEAVALGVRLSRPHVISAIPLPPRPLWWKGYQILWKTRV